MWEPIEASRGIILQVSDDQWDQILGPLALPVGQYAGHIDSDDLTMLSVHTEGRWLALEARSGRRGRISRNQNLRSNVLSIFIIKFTCFKVSGSFGHFPGFYPP
jgi:hypothetical protein